MSEFVLTEKAEADLAAIFDEILEHRPRTAQKVKNRILNACRLLASMPTLGAEHPYIKQEDLRAWTVYRYLIIYRLNREPLEIVRILMWGRDVKAISFD